MVSGCSNWSFHKDLLALWIWLVIFKEHKSSVIGIGLMEEINKKSATEFVVVAVSFGFEEC